MFSRDPLKEWFILIRFITYEKLQKLSGPALIAQDYYEKQEILKYFIEDVLNITQPNADELLNQQTALWKDKRYGDIRGYSNIDFLEQILLEYQIHPSPYLFLLVEGTTEENFFDELASTGVFIYTRAKIHIHNLSGVDKNFQELLFHFLKPRIGTDIDNKYYHLRAPLAKCFIFLDKEGRWKKILNNKKKIDLFIQKAIDRIRNAYHQIPSDSLDYLSDHLKIKIHSPSFEWAYFTNDQILEALNIQANRHGNKLTLTISKINECRNSSVPDLKKLYNSNLEDPGDLSKKELGKNLAQLISSLQEFNTTEIGQTVQEIYEFAMKNWWVNVI